MAEPQATEARGTLGTVRNAVRLLDLLSDGPAYQQLTDLAERSGLSVPTVHRLLRSLVLADLVEQDPHSSRYSLGPEVARLSQRYLGRLPVLGALSPYLASLRDTLASSVHVAVLVRESVVYVDHVEAGESGPYRDSHRVTDALGTPSGRLLAARAPDETWQWCAATCSAHDDQELARLRSEWSAAGHLADPAEADELAVVVEAADSPLAALSATLDGHRDPARLTWMAEQLRRAATAAGRTLGHG